MSDLPNTIAAQDYTLMHGDCLECMKELPAGSVDMILVDPPYGVTACKWDALIPYQPMWSCVLRAAKENAAIVFFSQMPFSAELVMSQKKLFRYEFVYEKHEVTNFMQSKIMPLHQHENIEVFYRKLPTYNPQFSYREPYTEKRSTNIGQTVWGNSGNQWRGETQSLDGKRYPTTILKFKNTGNNHFTHEYNGKHSTQKPVDLCAWLVRTYTNRGETVLDFCMGSGSTGVACMNEGRKFIGIEKDDKIFGTAVERVKGAAGNPAQKSVEMVQNTLF